MSRRSMQLAFGSWVGLVAGAALTGCGGGGGSAGAGNTQLVQMLTTSVPSAQTGVAYTTQFEAFFPHAPGRYLVTGGALPTGLTLDTQTGLLTGYPRQVGVFTFRIAARDGTDTSLPPDRDANFAQDTGDFQLVVALGPPHILPQQPPAAQYRGSYGYQIDVAGGTAPYIFQQVGGTLPTGLTVSTSGLLGNFPQQEKPDGSPYVFDVRVTDANGIQDTATLSVDVVVLPLLILTSSPLPQAAAQFPYSVTLQLASAGAGAPITWSQKLPLAMGETDLATLGMELTTQGILRNAAPNPGPLLSGTFTFTARVTDEAGQVATRSYSLKVNPGPVLTSITPNRAVGSPPFVLAGLNFQPGAVVIFKPGANQVQANPNTNTPTQLTLNSTPPTPSGGGGFVTVRVLNPDGGFSDLPNAFAFPASNLTFNGTPTFPSPQSALSSTGLAVADLNKDGFADFVHVGSQNNFQYDGVTPTTGGVHVMLNTPAAGVFNGTFSQVILNTGGDIQGVKLADVDSDGDLDIVVVGRLGGSLRVRTWLNPFPAAFTAATPAIDSNPAYDPGYNSSGIDLGRISPSDLVPDVAYSISDNVTTGGSSSSTWTGGSYQTLAGAGNGTFNSPLETNTTVPGIYSVGDLALADFDGDGRSDVFIGDLVAGYMGYNGFAGGLNGQQGSAALTNPATGLFGSWTPVGTNSGVNYTLGIAAGDVNGDGRADVVAAASESFGGGTAGLGVYQGSGTGSFSSVTPGAGSGRPRYATVFDGDFDFPGDVAVSVATNKVDIYKGRTGVLGLQFKQALTVTGSPKVGRVSTGDFNGDGRVDVCVTLSFYAVDIFGFDANDNGNGGALGVAIFLNTSN